MQNPYFDGIASIIIGLILTAVSVVLARESRGLLMGESVEAEKLRQMLAVVEQDEAVVRVLRSPSMYLAPEEVILMLVVDFHNDLSTSDINQAIIRIRATVQGEFPIVKQLFIEPGEDPTLLAKPQTEVLAS